MACKHRTARPNFKYIEHGAFGSGFCCHFINRNADTYNLLRRKTWAVMGCDLFEKVIWGENQAWLKLQPSFQNCEISEVSCVSTFHPYTRYIYILPTCRWLHWFLPPIPRTELENSPTWTKSYDRGISISFWPQVLNPAAFWMSTKNKSKSNIPAPSSRGAVLKP